ncbi:lipopolysaccharide assembly protein LapA domain-containing protein [Arthrobacter sp. AL12]|uniref:LapA family protein n=1 Tax=Arthrobacter sp. AL12 TaxID=3042241 RepID=UPI00249A3FB5|nr:lipopolysaccharide assembly protein LapA domain-containing protein [Arthrobacter sp. AL12]MDI3211707.1 lipopolysaccharide assembly protein LapA domain-containing protein [Arthrobacter sp. AL12]
MTQTPRGFDPHDPNSPNGASPTRSSGPADEYPGAADVPAGGTDLVSGAPAAPAPVEEPARAATPETPAPEPRQVTRAGMVWAAVACALVVLILLIAFILQNQEYVQVKFFGLQGAVPLGIALFIAAVGGGVLVAIAGAARIIQLRVAAHRQRVSRQARPGARTR